MNDNGFQNSGSNLGVPADGTSQFKAAQNAPQNTQYGTQQVGQPAVQNIQNYPASGTQNVAPDPAQGVAISTTPAHTDASATTYPDIAEDNDLIEKEWVQQAKNIVEKTRRDPFLQSQELTKLRTEYLQKRYGKTSETGGKN